MYPLALEHSIERLYESEFLSFAEPYQKRVLEVLQHFREETVQDGSRIVRFDSDLFKFLEELKEKSKRHKPKAILMKLQNQFQGLESFSRKILNKAIRKDYDVIEPINLKRSSAITKEILKDISRQNAELIQSLKGKHTDKLARIVREGVLQGRSNAELTKSFNKALGVNRRTAKFWGRDQASKFFGRVNQVNQTSAGFEGYIWRTVRDNRIRDTHATLEGTYHKWSEPPEILVNGFVKRLHTGEDYNCRCFPEPADSSSDAERKYIPAHSLEKTPEIPNKDIDTFLANRQIDEVSDEVRLTNPSLESLHLKSIWNYTNPKIAKSLNTGTREGSSTPFNQAFKRVLDASLARLPDYDGITYRHLSISEMNLNSFLKKYKKDKIVKETSFLSSSKGKSATKEAQHNVKLIIKGLTGKDIAGISREPKELEVLFRANTKFRVLDVQTTNNLPIIRLEEVEND